MRSNIADRWICALRSGEYVQGAHRLQSASGLFCCLGVLTDMAIKEGIGRWDYSRYHPTFIADDGQEDTNFLPAAVAEWAGVQSAAGRYGESEHSEDYLATRNDMGMSFEAIADLIDAHRERL